MFGPNFVLDLEGKSFPNALCNGLRLFCVRVGVNTNPNSLCGLRLFNPNTNSNSNTSWLAPLLSECGTFCADGQTLGPAHHVQQGAAPLGPPRPTPATSDRGQVAHESAPPAAGVRGGRVEKGGEESAAPAAGVCCGRVEGTRAAPDAAAAAAAATWVKGVVGGRAGEVIRRDDGGI